MKKTSLFIATALLACVPCVLAEGETTAPAPAKAEAKAETPEQKTQSPEELAKNIGYLFGYQTGQQMAGFGPVKIEDFDAEAFKNGLKAGLSAAKPDIEEAVVEVAFRQYQAELEKRTEAEKAKNVAEGKKFLEENAKKEGVVTTKSGLQYKVINKGGDKKYEAPKEGADMGTRFRINYKGTLPNGEVFDESREPIAMPLEVVPGFKEALTMMPVGAKWEIVLPAELAYGERSPGGKIGPNQVLAFEVELLEILPPDPSSMEGMKEMQLTPEQLEQLKAAMGGAAPEAGQGSGEAK